MPSVDWVWPFLFEDFASPRVSVHRPALGRCRGPVGLASSTAAGASNSGMRNPCNLHHLRGVPLSQTKWVRPGFSPVERGGRKPGLPPPSGRSAECASSSQRTTFLASGHFVSPLPSDQDAVVRSDRRLIHHGAFYPNSSPRLKGKQARRPLCGAVAPRRSRPASISPFANVGQILPTPPLPSCPTDSRPSSPR